MKIPSFGAFRAVLAAVSCLCFGLDANAQNVVKVPGQAADVVSAVNIINSLGGGTVQVSSGTYSITQSIVFAHPPQTVCP